MTKYSKSLIKMSFEVGEYIVLALKTNSRIRTHAYTWAFIEMRQSVIFPSASARRVTLTNQQGCVLLRKIYVKSHVS